MSDKIVSTYYLKNLPKMDDRKPSLSEIKLKKMNYERFNSTNVPKDIEELKKLRRRELAIEFMARYAAGTVKSKNAYIKEKHVSISTLNKALAEAGNAVRPAPKRADAAKPKGRKRKILVSRQQPSDDGKNEVSAGRKQEDQQLNVAERGESRKTTLEDVTTTSLLLKDVLKLNCGRKKENKLEKNNLNEDGIPA